MSFFGLNVGKAEPGFESPRVDNTALVTGSSGLCGARLVEMLVERGTQTVVAFDVAPPDRVLAERFEAVRKKYGAEIIVLSGSDGDLTSDEAVAKAFQVKKPNIVYHIAALVGPFYDRHLYFDVNLEGTKRIINYCKKYKVKKLVYSSSPGTRFTGPDIEYLSEDDLPIPDKFLAVYAEAKAYGEIEVIKACCDDLLTTSVAPHQIYGPHDKLFLAKFLETSGNGRLRIFGTGDYKISCCFVDNYCHGLMCGADALYKDSPALAKFYIITDDGHVNLWDMINKAGIAMGFRDLKTKTNLPVWFMYIVATVANIIGALIGKKFKLTYFSLRMITMHRYFNIKNAKNDLKYKPLKTFEEAFPYTLEWFKENWLPAWKAEQESKKLK